MFPMDRKTAYIENGTQNVDIPTTRFWNKTGSSTQTCWTSAGIRHAGSRIRLAESRLHSKFSTRKTYPSHFQIHGNTTNIENGTQNVVI